MSGRCKDCKHVRPAELYEPDLTCQHPKFLFGYHHDQGDMAPDGLLIEDDEGWGWVVGPEFGCVHFEPKNASTPKSGDEVGR